MTTGQEPVAGKLYCCVLTHGTTRICRYGYHRKNNDRNWSNPPAGSPSPSFVWYGWRDHENYRFIREEEVVSFVEVTDDGAGLFVPAGQSPLPAQAVA
jgi:hypothetical protein